MTLCPGCPHCPNARRAAAPVMGRGQPLLRHGGPWDMTARFRDSEVWARTHVLGGVAPPLMSPPLATPSALENVRLSRLLSTYK